jgi:hypothetical protein
MPRPIVLAALLLVCMPLLRIGPRAHATANERYEDIYYLPEPGWLRVFALGHRAALCDLLWIRALIYTGDEMVHRGTLRYVFDYTEAMLALDPDVEAIYHWIATTGLYQPDAITREEFVRTLDFLERGAERIPESGALQWDLGATYAFESAPYAADDAERRRWREAGAEHLLAATRMGAAPPWMVLANSALLAQFGATQRAVEHLEEMYAVVEDPTMRAEIGARIASLRGEAEAAAFLDESERFESARSRDYPYVDPNLYFVLGAPLDIAAPLREGYAASSFDDTLEAWMDPR